MGLTLAIVAGSILLSVAIAVPVLRSAGVLGPRKKVLATGIAGQATLLGSAPTGTVINEVNYVCRFRLRVQLPDRAPYDVETKDTVPITAMGALVPGTMLAVRVHPQKPEMVFIDWQQGVGTAGAAAATPSTADVAAALHDRSALASMQKGSAADLLRTGQPARGFLKSFSDTGQTVRMTGRTSPAGILDDPLYVLTVEMHFAEGMEPIEGTVVHRVPRAVVPTLRIGMELACAVDPGNPSRDFAINWGPADAAQQPAPWNMTKF